MATTVRHHRYRARVSETVSIAMVSAGAAVLASMITAVASLGVVMLQEHRRAKATEQEEFFAAAQVVLTKGLTMIDRCRLWSSLLQGHSKPLGAAAVLLRIRRPVDPAGILDPLIRDQEEINFAGARVVLHATDQETVALCNRVLRAADRLGAALLPGRRTGLKGYVASMAKGMAAPDMEKAQVAAAELADARRAFAEHLRSLRKRQHVDVYAVPQA